MGQDAGSEKSHSTVLASVVVEKSHYIAKLSCNSVYSFATAKVDISLPGSTVTLL